MPSKPRYQPLCQMHCQDRDGFGRPATEYIHVYGKTLFVCAACARAAFGLPSPATVARRRKRNMERLQEVLGDA